MADLVIPPGFYQATIHMQHSGSTRRWLVTLGMGSDGGTFDAQEIAEHVAAAVESEIVPVADQEVTFIEVTTRGNDPGTGAPVGQQSINEPGGIAVNTPPPNTALLVQKVTGFAGRHNRGRMYWPGILDETNIGDMGNISGGTVTGLQTVFDAFYTELTSVGALPDVAQVVILHTTEAPTTVPTVVTGFVVDELVATQRRRLRG